MGFLPTSLFTSKQQPIVLERIDRPMRIVPIIEGRVTELDVNGDPITVERTIVREICDRIPDVAEYISTHETTHVDFVYSLDDARLVPNFDLKRQFVVNEVTEVADKQGLALTLFDHPCNIHRPCELVVGLEEVPEELYDIGSILRV